MAGRVVSLVLIGGWVAVLAAALGGWGMGVVRWVRDRRQG